MKRLLAVCLSVVFFAATTFLSVAAASNRVIERIHLAVDSCNVRVERSDNNQFEYIYDLQKYALTTFRLNETLIIEVAKTTNTVGLMDMVVIRIPANDYEKISVHSTRSGIALPAGINAHFKIVNDGGSVSLAIANGFSGSVELDCLNGSGALVFDQDATNYTLTVHPKASAITADFPNFIPNRPYIYAAGDGTVVIALNIEGSSFSIGSKK